MFWKESFIGANEWLSHDTLVCHTGDDKPPLLSTPQLHSCVAHFRLWLFDAFVPPEVESGRLLPAELGESSSNVGPYSKQILLKTVLMGIARSSKLHIKFAQNANVPELQPCYLLWPCLLRSGGTNDKCCSCSPKNARLF